MYLALLTLSSAASGCSRAPEYDGCFTEHPAFLVRITAGGRPLPSDTRIRVQYGGSSAEERVLLEPAAAPDVIFCTTVDPLAEELDASIEASSNTNGSTTELDAASSQVTAVLCELWTQGAATITVQATGYRVIEQQLKASRNHCGIETVESELALQAPDAGI